MLAFNAAEKPARVSGPVKGVLSVEVLDVAGLNRSDLVLKFEEVYKQQVRSY